MHARGAASTVWHAMQRLTAPRWLSAVAADERIRTGMVKLYDPVLSKAASALGAMYDAEVTAAGQHQQSRAGCSACYHTESNVRSRVLRDPGAPSPGSTSRRRGGGKGGGEGRRDGEERAEKGGAGGTGLPGADRGPAKVGPDQAAQLPVPAAAHAPPALSGESAPQECIPAAERNSTHGAPRWHCSGAGRRVWWGSGG